MGAVRKLARDPSRATLALARVLSLATCGVVWGAGCGGALVHVRSDLGDLPERIDTIVSLPPRLGFGKLADQRRSGRYADDLLIEASGGRTVLAEELRGIDPELIPADLTALGEDPARAVTFSITAARGNRAEASELPGFGTGQALRHYADFLVRLDVRSALTGELLGSVETYASAYANAPEHDARGRPLGLAQASEEAIREAMRRFTPRLVHSPRDVHGFGKLVEIPSRRGGGGSGQTEAGPTVSASDRLHRLRVLYPEVPEPELARLSGSGARLLVLDPGRMRVFGIETGDLVRGAGAHPLTSRAALARTLARGDIPTISVDRPAGHFLLTRPAK
jgi:hypothetical protein